MNAAILLMATCIPGQAPDPAAVVPHPLMPLSAALGEPIPCPDGNVCPTTPVQPASWRPVAAALGEPAAPADNGPSRAEIVPVGYPSVRSASWPPVATVEPPLLADEAPASAVQPLTLPVIEVRPPAAALRGKLVVSLPPAAQLFIDDSPVQASMGENTFYTVPLPEGSARYYRLRGEVLHDGEAVGETVRAVVQAGRESWVCFPHLQTLGEAPRNEPLAAYRPVEQVPPPAATLGFQPVGFMTEEARPMAPTRGKLVVALPAGARLLIEGRLVRAVPGENTFPTPPLAAGAGYRYTVRAELVRGGQVFAEEMEVVVRGGEETRVSFPHLQTPPGATVRWPARRW